jgi:C4-type Zn-finger protein
MPLTLDQQRAVAKHLRSRAQPPQCPVCGASNMKVQQEVTLLPTADEASPDQPLISVVCNYCGYVLHLSPSAVGLSIDE